MRFFRECGNGDKVKLDIQRFAQCSVEDGTVSGVADPGFQGFFRSGKNRPRRFVEGRAGFNDVSGDVFVDLGRGFQFFGKCFYFRSDGGFGVKCVGEV